MPTSLSRHYKFSITHLDVFLEVKEVMGRLPPPNSLSEEKPFIIEICDTMVSTNDANGSPLEFITDAIRIITDTPDPANCFHSQWGITFKIWKVKWHPENQSQWELETDAFRTQTLRSWTYLQRISQNGKSVWRISQNKRKGQTVSLCHRPKWVHPLPTLCGSSYWRGEGRVKPLRVIKIVGYPAPLGRF